MDLFYLAVVGAFALATVALLRICSPASHGDRRAS